MPKGVLGFQKVVSKLLPLQNHIQTSLVQKFLGCSHEPGSEGMSGRRTSLVRADTKPDAAALQHLSHGSTAATMLNCC